MITITHTHTEKGGSKWKRKINEAELYTEAWGCARQGRHGRRALNKG